MVNVCFLLLKEFFGNQAPTDTKTVLLARGPQSKMRGATLNKMRGGDPSPEDTEDKVDQDDIPKVSPEDVVADREVESTEVDFWTCPGDVLMVHHVVPRSTLFIPTDENCPFPVKYLDVTRRIYTDLENKAEAEVEHI